MTDRTSRAVDEIAKVLENFDLLDFLRADLTKIQTEIFTIPTGQRPISESEADRIGQAICRDVAHFQIGAVTLIHLPPDSKIVWSLAIRQEDDFVTLKLSTPSNFRWERELTNLTEEEHSRR